MKRNTKIIIIINVQKMIRGYLVRKVINKVNVINDSLNNFLFIIAFSIKKIIFIFKKHDSVAPALRGKNNYQFEKCEKFSNKKITNNNHNNIKKI